MKVMVQWKGDFLPYEVDGAMERTRLLKVEVEEFRSSHLQLRSLFTLVA